MEEKRKNYVIDSSVLVFDPSCIMSFVGNNVIIPNSEIRKLEEMVQSKKEMTRYQAKEAINFIRNLDGITGIGTIKGIKLENDIILYTSEVVGNHSTAYYSDSIYEVLTKVKENIKGKNGEILKTVLVSKVMSLRIAAISRGYEAEDYKAGRIIADDGYTGVTSASYELFNIQDVCEERKDIEVPSSLNLLPNEFLNIKNADDEIISSYRYDAKENVLKYVDVKALYKHTVYGVKPLNNLQALAMNLLLDPSVELVSLAGTAGTGKTLLSVAAALHQTLPKGNHERLYKRIIFVKPMVAAGEEMGFIPGNILDKIIPWMGSLYDSLENLIADDKEEKSPSKQVEEFVMDNVEKGFLQLSPTTYLRGRTFNDAFVIVDEAQGITPHIMKTILNRKGKNSKIVIAGDPSDNQIDTELLDSYYNGLVYASQRLKKSRFSGMVQFDAKNIVRSSFLEDVEAML